MGQPGCQGSEQALVNLWYGRRIGISPGQFYQAVLFSSFDFIPTPVYLSSIISIPVVHDLFLSYFSGMTLKSHPGTISCARRESFLYKINC